MAALITCNFFSNALAIETAVQLLVPQEGNWLAGIPDHRYPTLWLLHGLSDDQTIWQRRTSIERYVETLPLAVVMPAVNRSFYADMRHGPAYWTYISEELPALMRAWFPLSAAREDNFVAGLSMGGYGAFRLGLTFPDRFAAAASLSGALDMASDSFADPLVGRDLQIAFESPAQFAGSEADQGLLARRVAENGGTRPRLYLACGTEDFLYAQNVRFRDVAVQLGLELTYEEGPGEHTWDYWDAQIQRVIAWLPLADESDE